MDPSDKWLGEIVEVFYQQGPDSNLVLCDDTLTATTSPVLISSAGNLKETIESCP